MAGSAWVQGALVDDDRGFTSEAWSDAPVFDHLRRSRPGQTIFTNGVDVIAFHTGRDTRPVPEKRMLLTGEPNPSFDAEVWSMLEENGILIWFNAPARRVFLPTPEELGLQTIRRDRVSTTYRLSGG